MDIPELPLFYSCVGFVSFFVLLFGVLSLTRWLRHRETMAMIEKGMIPPNAAKRRNGNGKGLLVWGVGISFFGLALMGGLCMLLVLIARPGSTLLSRSFLLFFVPGLMVLFVGIALLIVYFITRPDRDGGTPTADPSTAELEAVETDPAVVEFEAKVSRDE